MKTSNELRAALNMIQARLDADAAIDCAGWMAILDALRAAERYAVKCYRLCEELERLKGKDKDQ